MMVSIQRWNASRWLGMAAILAAGAAGLLRAQESPNAARVTALNQEVLRLHGEAQRATPNGIAAGRAQAGSVLEQRAAALSALIAENPAQALALAFSSDLLGQLALAFPGSASQLESRGAWEGPAEYLVLDDARMLTRQSATRLKLGQAEFEVYFAGDEPPGLQSGVNLRVTGMRAGNRLAAEGGTVTGYELAASACVPTGPQKAAVLLVTFPGVAAPSITPQSISDIFFGASGRSVDAFWRENSYNQTSVSGDVFGWYTLDALYTCAQTSLLRAAAIAVADADVNFQNYNRLFIVFPNPGGCSFAGAASLGCSSLSSAGDGSFTSSYAYLVSSYMSTRDQGVKLSTHEAGHNLGFLHASTRDFGAEALGPLGTTGTLSEYGDVFSTMGSWNLGHYASPHKVQAGWLSSGVTYQTVQANGIFSLQPFEVSPPGLQALRVQRGTGNDAWVWVEYRQPIGSYDSTLNSQIFSGALLHYEDSTTGSKTHLLDFTPETTSWSDPALAAGKTWADPYSNLWITVNSATATALTVTVNYGAVTCSPANPTVSLSPSNPSVVAGGAASYTLTVTNNDTFACSASTFNLSSAQPSGWTGAPGAASLTLGPGQSASTTLSETSPAGATPGTYPVSASAARGSNSGSGPASCTVMEPLAASLTVPAGPYAPRSTVKIVATATLGSSPASGASVHFTLVKPGGSTTTKDTTTGSTGQAVWTYRLGPKDPKGTYSVSATVTLGSQTVTTAPASFTVQ